MIAAVSLGCLIGLTVGVLGAGGSILAVPALVYGVGLPVHQAIPISLVVVGVAALVGLVPRLRERSVRWPVAMVFGGAGAVTAFAGAAVGGLISPRVLLLSFAVLMVVAAVQMLVGSDVPRGSCAGFIAVPVLVLLLGLEMPVAVGTSLVIVLINSIAGLVAHLHAAAHLDLRITGAFASGALLATAVSSPLASRLPPDRLRQWFAYLVLGVAVYVAVQAILNPAALG
ncbi:MAG: sulfite exporter TauE/SafE family protein [Actinobacteria bacterium]|nr:sulfite exporter TauE/SafE family protein [Actinomycetota bacterium]